MSSGTPVRLATAVATSLAVRTCAASGVNVTSTVDSYFSDFRLSMASSTVLDISKTLVSPVMRKIFSIRS